MRARACLASRDGEVKMQGQSEALNAGVSHVLLRVLNLPVRKKQGEMYVFLIVSRSKKESVKCTCLIIVNPILHF